MIDELERKVLRALNANARKSFREVAREVGSSVTAVCHKVKRLEESGAIRGYIPVLDPVRLGFDLIAIIALRISKGRLLETQQKIAGEACLSAVYDVTGEWDSLLVGHFRDRAELNDFIKRLLSLPHVDRSVTHIVLNTVKEERRLPV
jgi:DNA-binding Lrp family transcriptional regulator